MSDTQQSPLSSYSPPKTLYIFPSYLLMEWCEILFFSSLLCTHRRYTFVPCKYSVLMSVCVFFLCKSWWRGLWVVGTLVKTYVHFFLPLSPFWTKRLLCPDPFAAYELLFQAKRKQRHSGSNMLNVLTQSTCL